MPARSAFQVRVLGLDDLQRLEKTLEGSSRRFADRLAQEIASEIGQRAPDDGRHRLADSWKGRAISDNLAVVESNHPAAKARDRGAYIVAKPGHTLRFEGSGGVVFARFAPGSDYRGRGIRQKGTRYIEKALARRRVIAEAVFEQEFGSLKTKAVL